MNRLSKIFMISRNNIIHIVIYICILSVSVAFSILVDNQYALIVHVAVCSLSIVAAMVIIYKIFYKNIHSTIEKYYKKTESYYAVMATIKPIVPLQASTVWSASPDLLRELCRDVAKNRPNTILEAGSGISTIAIGYMLKNNGAGKLISLENKKDHWDNIESEIKIHKLENYVTAIYAQLKEYKINDKIWKWYNCDGIKDLGAIDMMFIDGPSKNIQRYSRYPAIPLCRNMLKNGAVIILDDAEREDEKEIVARWRNEYGIEEIHSMNCERGAMRLKWIKK